MVTRGAKTYEGFFKLYQKDDRLYLELPPDKMNKPFLCPIAVARGAGLGGETLNNDEQWVLLFKRVGDKVQLIRRNVHFKAKAGTPTARAVETTYSDSVLMALRIATVNPTRGMAPLVNLNDIFMTRFRRTRPGRLRCESQLVGQDQSLPPKRRTRGECDLRRPPRRVGHIDHRGTSVVIHYGLVELPTAAINRASPTTELAISLPPSRTFRAKARTRTFVRYVNRWRLDRAEPADPKHPNKLSVPTRSIKYYIEKTVPHEYRAAVQEGILEWNKAFEKIGFRNAIEVVQHATMRIGTRKT